MANGTILLASLGNNEIRDMNDDSESVDINFNDILEQNIAMRSKNTSTTISFATTCN